MLLIIGDDILTLQNLDLYTCEQEVSIKTVEIHIRMHSWGFDSNQHIASKWKIHSESW